MYIINPMTFYWLSVLDAIRTLLLVVSIIGVAAAVVLPLVFCAESCWDKDEKKKYIKALIAVLIVLFVSILLVVFIPSKQTMIEMMVAKYATTENAEWTVDALKSAVDYIVEAMKSVK